MKLVVTAGTVRSGTTWLYNTVRYCYLEAGYRVYGAYVDQYDQSVDADVHVVKVHDYDPDLAKRADLILMTKRDLRDVAASIVRKGWKQDEPAELVPYLKSILHTQVDLWVPLASMVFQYDGGDFSHGMCAILKLSLNPSDVAIAISDLKRVVLTQPDPVTQMHPGHITDGRVGSYADTLKPETIAAIEEIMRQRGELP